MSKLQGGHVPQFPIAGDANAERRGLRLLTVLNEVMFVDCICWHIPCFLQILGEIARITFLHLYMTFASDTLHKTDKEIW